MSWPLAYRLKVYDECNEKFLNTEEEFQAFLRNCIRINRLEDTIEICGNLPRRENETDFRFTIYPQRINKLEK